MFLVQDFFKLIFLKSFPFLFLQRNIFNEKEKRNKAWKKKAPQNSVVPKEKKGWLRQKDVFQ